MGAHIAGKSSADDIISAIPVEFYQCIAQAQIAHMAHMQFFMRIGLRILNHCFGRIFDEVPLKHFSVFNFIAGNSAQIAAPDFEIDIGAGRFSSINNFTCCKSTGELFCNLIGCVFQLFSQIKTWVSIMP